MVRGRVNVKEKMDCNFSRKLFSINVLYQEIIIVIIWGKKKKKSGRVIIYWLISSLDNEN